MFSSAAFASFRRATQLARNGGWLPSSMSPWLSVAGSACGGPLSSPCGASPLGARYYRSRSPPPSSAASKKDSIPPLQPLPPMEELIPIDGPEDDDSDDDGAGAALSSSEQQAVTKQLLAIENPVYTAVSKTAYLAKDIMPPTLGAAWYRLPRCNVTAALPRSWKMHAGKGRLLTLPYAQVVCVPPGAPTVLKPKAGAGADDNDDDDDEDAEEETDVARCPVSLTVSRFPKALNAPIIRSMQRTTSDLARFLMSFLVIKHGPSGLVTREGMDEGKPDPSESPFGNSATASAGASGGFDAFNPNVTVLASWSTEGPSPLAEPATGGGAGRGAGGGEEDRSMKVFGLEFSVPVSIDETGLKKGSGGKYRGNPSRSSNGAAADEPQQHQKVNLRFNSTLLLDSLSGDVVEVTFRCPDELWDAAWEGLDPDEWAPSKYLNSVAGASGASSDDEEDAEERKRKEAAKEAGEKESERKFGRRKRGSEQKKDKSAAEEKEEEIKPLVPHGRKVRRRPFSFSSSSSSAGAFPLRGRPGGPPVPPILDGLECISAKRILDSATVTAPWES